LPATFNLDGPIQYKESKYEEAVAPNAEGFQEKSEDELSKIRQHDIDEFLKSDSIMNEEDLTRLVSQLINQYYYLSHIWNYTTGQITLSRKATNISMTNYNNYMTTSTILFDSLTNL